MTRRPLAIALLLALSGMAPGPSLAQNLPNLTYATVDGTPLRLDLYRPTGATAPTPVVLWIHGGGWCAGARSPLAAYAAPLVQAGVTVAAVQYRLSSTTPDCANGNGATWPAQIHDLKGAVRWLRALAATYQLDPSRIGVWGQSAGAHLALTLALSPGDASLEGTVGGNPGLSSAVRAVVAYFPPTDLLQLGPDFALPPTSRPDLVNLVDGPGQPHARLIAFGGPGEGIGPIRNNIANPAAPWPTLVARTRSASPLTWVDATDVPVYLLHGSADTVVPVAQSRRLRDALVGAGVSLVYVEVPGLGHVPPSDPAQDQAARDWLVGRLTSVEGGRSQESSAPFSYRSS
ncbi:MAG: alpha/beta hydrolase [Xanthomonadales bacterium]|jgi:acetyl esterase/lipase|nr:alpha/beta hydrolase [Xanthomonadales bacterium]